MTDKYRNSVSTRRTKLYFTLVTFDMFLIIIKNLLSRATDN